MSLKRDYILRIVEELARAIARITALRAKGSIEAAIREVEEAASAIAGMDLRMAGSVDTATVARHLADPVRMAALARLMHERATLAGDQGGAASAWRRRAVELWLEAADGGAALDEVARAAIEALPESELGARARELRTRALPPR
jgi:hypothetical protein